MLLIRMTPIDADQSLIDRLTLFRCCCNQRLLIAVSLLLLPLIDPLLLPLPLPLIEPLLLLLLSVIRNSEQHENYDELTDRESIVDPDHSTAAPAATAKRKE